MAGRSRKPAHKGLARAQERMGKASDRAKEVIGSMKSGSRSSGPKPKPLPNPEIQRRRRR